MTTQGRWVSSLLALALGVLLAWRIGASPSSPRARTTPGTGTLVVWEFDQDLGWAPTPDARLGQVSIGPQGARGPRAYPSTPPAGACRIVALGESFVFGLEVSDEACWSARLEALDRRVEAINLGVPGYGPDQALLRYRRLGAALEPDVVVLGLGFTSIARVVNRLRSRLRPAHEAPSVKPRFRLVRNQLELVPLPFTSGDEVHAAAVDQRLEGRLGAHEYWRSTPAGPRSTVFGRELDRENGPGRRDVRQLWLDRKREPYQLTLAIAARLAAEAREGGAQPLVVYFPEDWELVHHRRGARTHLERMRADLTQRGVELLDLTPSLAASPTPVHRTLHLDARGHGIVASALYDWLRASSRVAPCPR